MDKYTIQEFAEFIAKDENITQLKSEHSIRAPVDFIQSYLQLVLAGIQDAMQDFPEGEANVAKHDLPKVLLKGELITFYGLYSGKKNEITISLDAIDHCHKPILKRGGMSAEKTKEAYSQIPYDTGAEEMTHAVQYAKDPERLQDESQAMQPDHFNDGRARISYPDSSVENEAKAKVAELRSNQDAATRDLEKKFAQLITPLQPSPEEITLMDLAADSSPPANSIG